MPKEDRRIIFSYEELYKAIYALCAQKQIPTPPPGAMQSAIEAEGDPDTIIIKLHNPQDTFDQDVECDYKRDFIAAALMLFCKGLGIPLPKTARKSVLIRDGIVMLRVQI